MIGAVGSPHVIKHPVAAAAAKIEVDVGQVGAGGVQKALEQQAVGDRIDVGDAGAVGDQRVGHAAAGVDRHAGPAGKTGDVGHDQEQRRIAAPGDGGQLDLQPFLHRR